MASIYPNTRHTLLGRLKTGRIDQWQNAWSEFYDLYHRPIRIAVIRHFSVYGHKQPPEIGVNEIVMDVVYSLFKDRERFTYDPSVGRFRNYLDQLIRWRVLDFLKKQNKQIEPLPENEDDHKSWMKDPQEEQLKQEETHAFQQARLGELLLEVRKQVSPQTYAFFELVKLQQEKPSKVARTYNVKRNVVDNAVYKVMKKLKELAQNQNTEWNQP